MVTRLTAEQVWREIEQNLFAVLGMVTSHGEARTVGVVYVVDDHKLYVGTQREAWKTRHIAQNPHVSVTIPLTRRLPFLPWIKIPAATITFSGRARVLEHRELSAGLLGRLYHDVVKDAEAMAASCVIEIVPEKEFVTYGVGTTLMEMRFPEKARGRVTVSPA
jgi:nitroimidazol reductase NimA-like FMN-containing flavoprotein (pyridoxamine 5'-phosphate oxidase superfamily)